jgi:hypothetical protein
MTSFCRRLPIFYSQNTNFRLEEDDLDEGNYDGDSVVVAAPSDEVRSELWGAPPLEKNIITSDGSVRHDDDPFLIT